MAYRIDLFGKLTNSNPLGIKRFVSGISISFKCECNIIMQIQYTKNLEPGDLHWVQHWVKIAGHGHTNHKQALRVHQSKSHQQYFLWKNPKFSSFSTCCFYSLERLLFLSRIFSDTFFLSFLPMLKRWKNCQFFTKTSDNPFGKIPNFFFLSRILSNTLCWAILPIFQ